MPDIVFASCHPGWADTPGVDGWLGSGKIALAPMRTLWQGTEGIAWLCACEAAQIESGAFYLDRSPAPKHMVRMRKEWVHLYHIACPCTELS